MGDEANDDERLDFLFKQVQSTYKNVNMEKFEVFTSSDSTLNAVYEVRRLTLGSALVRLFALSLHAHFTSPMLTPPATSITTLLHSFSTESNSPFTSPSPGAQSR